MNEQDEDEADEEFKFPENKQEAKRLAKRFYKDASSIPLPKTSSLQTRFLEELPFLTDKGKMQRFEAFVAEKEGQYYEPVFGNMMKASELREEKELFERVYHRNEKLKLMNQVESLGGDEEKKSQVQRKLDKLENNKITREYVDWVPSDVLCKRFGILAHKKK